MNPCILYCVLCLFINFVSTERSFTVDYDNNSFLKDGKPFRYVSGSIHYFRVPWQLWQDRLYKMKMAGLNAIQTYVEWSHHEPEPGVYNFKENYDLVKFLQTAQKLDLLVILRVGPFIDAERDMGGLPYWLLRVNPDMKLRTYDKSYVKYVDRWFGVLLPIIRPLLYQNGGPIITLQIENEYGSVAACDAQYTSHLHHVFKNYLKDEVVFFTTDGSSSHAVMCGKIDGVLSTIDFGTGANVSDLFDMLRWHQSSGPFVNSEFYPGWLDHWGEPHAKVSSKAVADTLLDVLSANASINIYMFHGGTSFGFSAGSNIGGTFQACPTSYDYDAPLSEAGDPTEKYYSIRTVIGKFYTLPPGPVPAPAPKMELKPVMMNKVSSLWSTFSALRSKISAEYPLPFEDLRQPYGYVLYETTVMFMTTDPILLSVPSIADRGYVYVNQVFQGILSREHKIYSIPLQVQKKQHIYIIVENQGRVCFGPGLNDRKGIFMNVTLGSTILTNWTMTVVNLEPEVIENLQKQVKESTEFSKHRVPAFYTGKFTVPKNSLLDTFLRLDGWHKGVAFINGFNLGRYWPIVGPQVTLYVPSVLLKEEPEANVITLLEMEHSPCSKSASCYVSFVKTPVVNGTTLNDYFSSPSSEDIDESEALVLSSASECFACSISLSLSSS